MTERKKRKDVDFDRNYDEQRLLKRGKLVEDSLEDLFVRLEERSSIVHADLDLATAAIRDSAI
jgi:hypothetical protein